MAYVLTIAGVPKAIQPGWDFSPTANGRALFRFKVKSLDGTYRPALDEEVTFSEDGTPIFGGFIVAPSEAGIGDIGWTKIVTTVQAQDYNVLPSRRVVNETIPAGTLKDALIVLVTYLTGVTLDPAQIDGPSLGELIWADVNLEDVLNQLSTLTGGYIWEITPAKELRMFPPGTVTAPFDITSANRYALGDVTVEPQRKQYANRVIVRTASFRKIAEDAGEIALRGAWDLPVSAPDETPEAGVQALADAILAESLPIIKKVSYTTRQKGLMPGMTQIINLPARNINNTFLVTDVSMFDMADHVVARRVTAIEGLVYRQGWQEKYRQWNGGGATSIGFGGGGGGGGGPVRALAFLGGTGINAVRPPTSQWWPASGGTGIGDGAIHVQLDTVTRGTTAATVTVRMRALQAGIGVKARLYDVSAPGATPGESSVVTSTTWQTVQFATTLTPGAHFYELQLFPSVGLKDVLGVGWVV